MLSVRPLLIVTLAACASTPPRSYVTMPAAQPGPSAPAAPPAPPVPQVALTSTVSPIVCVPKGPEGRGAQFCDFKDVHVFDDGSYVVAGGLWGHVELGGKPYRSKGRQNTLLVWVDAAGSITRTNLMGRTWNNVITNVSAAPDRSLIVGGFASNGFHRDLPKHEPVYEERPFVGAFGSDGKLLFVRPFEEVVIDVKATADGYVVVGREGLVRVFAADGSVKHERRLELVRNVVFVKALIASAQDMWVISYRNGLGDKPHYELVATHHVAGKPPVATTLATQLGRSWSQAYAGVVDGDVIVAGKTQDTRYRERVRWWRVDASGEVEWTGEEPLDTRPAAVDDATLRAAVVTPRGMTIVMGYVVANRTALTSRVLHVDVATGQLAKDARSADRDLDARLGQLYYGGDRQLMAAHGDGALIHTTTGQRGIDPIVQLEKITMP